MIQTSASTKDQVRELPHFTGRIEYPEADPDHGAPALTAEQPLRPFHARRLVA